MHPPDGISVFLQRVDRPRRLARVVVCAVTDALVLTCVVWLVETVAPAFTWHAITVAILWLVGATIVRYARGRTSVAELDAEFGCEDALVTWVEHADATFAATRRRDAPRDSMMGWLETALATRLAAIPPVVVRARARSRLRPLRYLVPLLIALLVLRWLQPTFLTPPLGGGAGGGAAGAGSGGGSGGGGAATASAGGNSSPTEGPGESTDPDSGSNPEETAGDDAGERPPDTPAPIEGAEDQSSEPDRPPEPDSPASTPPAGPDDSEPEGSGGPPPNADSPLLDLAMRDDFVIPQFVGEGPSEVGSAQVSEVATPVDGVPSPPPNASPAGRDGSSPNVPSTPQEELARFERAAERALRSRHIAEDERAIVRRYFELVLENRGRR